MSTVYPATEPARDRFILDRRRARLPLDPWRAQDVILEEEPQADGTLARVAVVLLTGRECPWRCVMCDLWQHTLATDTPNGAIPAQIANARAALRGTGRVGQMKLYNAGSFFDPRAVPDADYRAIASALGGLDRVIVESHPALVGTRIDRFHAELDRANGGRAPACLEVAMGLETAHPVALERLNKRMTLEDFARAADALATRGVALRAFVLVDPPFVREEEQEIWLRRSIDVAQSCGAGVVSLVPTRSGNGAMEALTLDGLFRSPALATIERRAEAVFAHGGQTGRILVDLWDLHRFADCVYCLDARKARLQAMNLEQRILPPVRCSHCGIGP